MKKFLGLVVLLAVGVGALGYWRGWFSVNTVEDKVDVQGHPTKFKQDRDAFSKTAGEKAKAMKEKLANLWKKTEGLSGDDKAHSQKELDELKKQHDRLEQQLKELEDAGEGKFDSIKHDTSKALEEVEKKIDELTNKMNKKSDK